jgi:hypothetical protein
MEPGPIARLRITLDVDYPAGLVGRLGRATETHLTEAMEAVPEARLRLEGRNLRISGVAGLSRVLEALHHAAVAVEAQAREPGPGQAVLTGPLSQVGEDWGAGEAA